MKYICLLVNIGYIYSLAINKVGIEYEWEEHKSKYGLTFDSEEEEERRYQIYYTNRDHIREHNHKNVGFLLGMNEFGHMEPHEVVRMVLDKVEEKEILRQKDLTKYKKMNLSVDWRKNNVVSSVKHQRSCNSDYAFSAIGAVESQAAILTGELKELSVQEILDCSEKFGNNRCKEGYTTNAFEYIMDNGVEEVKYYPYTAESGTCKSNKALHRQKIRNYNVINFDNEMQLLDAVEKLGPTTIYIDASSRDFIFYKSGNFFTTNCSKTSLNHFLLVVGYNAEGNDNYYIVKNSWGESWGEKGYIRIKMFYNTCGVASYGVYPII